MRMRFCEVCVSEFEPTGRHSYYCSTACLRVARADRARSTACRMCGRPGKGGTVRRLCSSCYWVELKAKRDAVVASQIWVKPCSRCATLAVFRTKPGGPVRYCSACKADAVRAVNRRKNSKRRGVRPSGEMFTIDDVGQRDGWRCHICGKKVRRDLSGMDPRGPTIDHLIPVVADGSDQLVNVALAHRQCNVIRRDTGPAQLRLIA